MITKSEMLQMLKNDVIPALGCTEPVCAALAAADASKAVGGKVEKIYMEVNPNIYKNGMSVAIPGCDDVGLDYAAAIGAVLRNPEKKLQILEDLTEESIKEVKSLIEKGNVEVLIAKDEKALYVKAEITTSEGVGVSVIRGAHTNIVQTTVNGQDLVKKDMSSKSADSDVVERLKEMKVSEIRELVDSASEEELTFMLDGIEMNNRIADYGMNNEVGVGITKTFKEKMDTKYLSSDIMTKIMMKVMAAAEGRLGGCQYPSMSSSGAGTKGLVVILPIAEVAAGINATKEMTVKAVAFGHLMNRYINEYVGKLAATCSCSMASATAASAAITWLLGGKDEQIGFAIRNMTGTVTGMICDGGKVGCALKVGMAAMAGYTNALLASQGTVLRVSDGVCAETPEECIKNMGIVGNLGMAQADENILQIMLDKKH